MVSPARASFMRKAAAVAAAAAADPTLDALRSTATAYELTRAALGQALAQVKNIQSIEAKIERKRELLPDFMPWVDGVLAADREALDAGAPYRAEQDDILTQAFIWNLDVGNFAKGLELAEFILRHRLSLPERFKRTAATIVAEEIAEAALKAAAQGEPFDLPTLQSAEALTAGEDMPDEVRAKLKKAIGFELARQADAMNDEGTVAGGKRAAAAAALVELRRALELNGRCGVKKEIERLERIVKRLAPAQG